MRKEDIDQVTEIDREAFPSMWPPVNYQHELDNPLAHYVVVADNSKVTEEPEVKTTPQKGFSQLIFKMRRLFNYERISNGETPPSSKQYITGFAGFWVMADEAHIISLAVRKTLYHSGIGELLLIAIIDLAAQLKARIITLEVRASNNVAINLYNKYGFTQVGLRRGYYIDNKEDAILMSTEDINSASFQARLQQLKESHSRKWQLPLYQLAR
jgi:ribosomal-protein-alanine N-acetyltransferase